MYFLNGESGLKKKKSSTITFLNDVHTLRKGGTFGTAYINKKL
jgi:hypothetical protein